jgi:glycosyltransferase involved in cell wall biosynthesis
MSSPWPAAPPPVVPRDRLPPQPAPGRVKVLHVITRFFGGSGGNTLLSAAGMDHTRYETWVAAAPGGPLWREARQAGVRTVELPRMRERISPLHDLLTLRDLVLLMRRERFTVVHTHCAKAGLLGRLAARLTRVPVVVHTFHAFAVHRFMSAGRRSAYLSLDRLARPLAHHYIAVSPLVGREAVERRLARPGSIVVVPSAVSLDEIPARPDPTVRRGLGIPNDVPVVGTVGRFCRQKAPLDFVRMAALVKQARPDVAFVMVGDATLESAPLERQTRDEAERLGVDVVFTGFRADAPRIAATFDVFVISSLYEGLGRALTEAMASGRPVVATAVNGVPDLVEPGATGLLAAPADPAGLAASVVWLLDHPEHAQRMGQQGRNRVLSFFDPATMCAHLDQLYARLLGLPAPRVAESSTREVTRRDSVAGDGPVPADSSVEAPRAWTPAPADGSTVHHTRVSCTSWRSRRREVGGDGAG